MTSTEQDPLKSHARPQGVSEATVKAAGQLGKALETMERARGHLYEFHQLSGTADLQLQDAASALADAGHSAHAERLRSELVGRNLLADRWSFQIIEEYDDGYVDAFRAAERRVRDDLMAGRRHVYEAEMKRQEISAELSTQQPGPGMGHQG